MGPFLLDVSSKCIKIIEVTMGDLPVEEIIAEPEEPTFFVSALKSSIDIVSSNGWYIVAIAAITYYIYKNYFENNSSLREGRTLQTPEDVASQNSKDEARRQAVLRLQQKYQKESEERAEQLRKIEEKKKKERLEELERLEAIRGGKRLGDSQTKKSFRPEYNPLMGDTSGSQRACSRPSTGRQGG
ncbi:unnamed protein product [Allacma fusca]|uniref:Selenoprotein S n=1 Tax=Allacma fusca TaxID=39272 RepID=A0A8J2LF96_9HEXA|nr:unnamed protein product [Allacma fusca]